MNAPEFITITSASEVCGILKSGSNCIAKSKRDVIDCTVIQCENGILCTARRYNRTVEQHEFKKMVQVVKWTYRWLKEIKEIDSYENRN